MTPQEQKTFFNYCNQDNIPGIIKILSNIDFKVCKDEKNRNALHYVFASKNALTSNIIIEHLKDNADLLLTLLTMRDSELKSPLHYAAEHSKIEIFSSVFQAFQGSNKLNLLIDFLQETGNNNSITSGYKNIYNILKDRQGKSSDAKELYNYVEAIIQSLQEDEVLQYEEGEFQIFTSSTAFTNNYLELDKENIINTPRSLGPTFSKKSHNLTTISQTNEKKNTFTNLSVEAKEFFENCIIGNIHAIKKTSLIDQMKDKKDIEGKTALHHAAQNNQFEVFKLLLDNDKNINFTRKLFTTIDNNLKNPLHYAAEQGNVEIFDYIFKKLSYDGYMISMINNHDKDKTSSVLDIATKNKNKSANHTLLYNLLANKENVREQFKNNIYGTSQNLNNQTTLTNSSKRVITDIEEYTPPITSTTSTFYEEEEPEVMPIRKKPRSRAITDDVMSPIPTHISNNNSPAVNQTVADLPNDRIISVVHNVLNKNSIALSTDSLPELDLNVTPLSSALNSSSELNEPNPNSTPIYSTAILLTENNSNKENVNKSSPENTFISQYLILKDKINILKAESEELLNQESNLDKEILSTPLNIINLQEEDARKSFEQKCPEFAKQLTLSAKNEFLQSAIENKFQANEQKRTEIKEREKNIAQGEEKHQNYKKLCEQKEASIEESNKVYVKAIKKLTESYVEQVMQERNSLSSSNQR